LLESWELYKEIFQGQLEVGGEGTCIPNFLNADEAQKSLVAAKKSLLFFTHDRIGNLFSIEDLGVRVVLH
jgi:hypothetical protein